MAKINLRPWREELRAEKQKQFVVMILGTVIIAGGLAFLWKSDMDSRIAYQQSRNAYIETATKELDKQIKEIENLKRQRDELLARMQVIQDLQGKRPVIVRVFDELVRTIPDGLYYTDLKKTGERLDIEPDASVRGFGMVCQSQSDQCGCSRQRPVRIQPVQSLRPATDTRARRGG